MRAIMSELETRAASDDATVPEDGKIVVERDSAQSHDYLHA